MKGFWKTSCSYHVSYLRYLQSCKPTSQISKFLIISIQNFELHTKIELLIIFLEKWYKHEIITSYFSSQEKITDAIIQNDGELIGIFFQMVSWCTTIAPNFLFLVYHYPELWTSYKNDPAQAYAYPSWSRINRFKWF